MNGERDQARERRPCDKLRRGCLAAQISSAKMEALGVVLQVRVLHLLHGFHGSTIFLATNDHA